jgi:transposase-like protein
MNLPAPTTLPEFDALFPDEEACVEYLYLVRWGDGFVCPKCGDTHASVIKTRGLVECRKGHQTSVTAGTAMHRSKQSLRTWFYAAFLVSTLKPGISAVQFQGQLGLSRYETAFHMLHKLRSALVAPGREKLRGEVEIDEAFIGGAEEGRPGRGAETKRLVIFAVEVIRWIAPDPKAPDDPDRGVEKTKAGRIRVTVIPDASAETLLPWVEANVEKGALVVTDGWAGYNGVKALGYEHKRVLQSSKGVKTGVYLPMVHLIISNLKRVLLGTYKGAISPQHLPAYLNEFVFRFNRRWWRGPSFSRAIGLMAAAEKRPEYDTLYGVKAKEEGAWVRPNPRRVVSGRVVEVIVGDLEGAADADLREWIGEHRADVREVVRTSCEARAR